MREKFDRQLNRLNAELTDMGNLAVESIRTSIEALKTRDRNLIQRCIEFDAEIKELEKRIESRCIKLILKQQPVASDLRLISSALKMVTDMERIGKQSVDIAEITLQMIDKELHQPLTKLTAMSELTVTMVEESIKSFVTGDLSLVDKVAEYDDKVDAYFDLIKDQIIDLLKKDLEDPGVLINLLMITKYLERIGDHAENISNWVNFSITGVHKDKKLV